MFRATLIPIDEIKASDEYHKLYNYGTSIVKRNPFTNILKAETIFMASYCLPFFTVIYSELLF
jgi:hypothetical protein